MPNTGRSRAGWAAPGLGSKARNGAFFCWRHKHKDDLSLCFALSSFSEPCELNEYPRQAVGRPCEAFRGVAFLRKTGYNKKTALGGELAVP